MPDETIISTNTVRIRIMELAEDASTEWHHHTQVVDFFVCLTGTVTVETRNPDEAVVLRPGSRFTVGCGRVHRVVNIHSGTSEYLLVQGEGAYDFIRDPTG